MSLARGEVSGIFSRAKKITAAFVTLCIAGGKYGHMIIKKHPSDFQLTSRVSQYFVDCVQKKCQVLDFIISENNNPRQGLKIVTSIKQVHWYLK